jgi:hypothetical protein
MKIILPGTLENISTRADGSIKFTFGTQELDPAQAGNLFQLRNRYVKCLLSDSNITNMEADVVDASEIKDGKKVKSASQRFRAVLFRLHEAERIPAPFDDWYNNEMERLIEHYKGKIETAA